MEFVSRDAEAGMRGSNVRAMLDAFQLIPPLGRYLLEKHGLALEDLRDDHFIPLQRCLDALREIEETVGPDKLREVGRNIIEAAHFPPEYPGAESILLGLDAIYHLNHRGDVGHYRVSREGDGTIVVRCETPYPRMFEWGLVEGICRNPRVGGRFLVDFTAGPTGGDLTCTLRVRRSQARD